MATAFRPKRQLSMQAFMMPSAEESSGALMVFYIMTDVQQAGMISPTGDRWLKMPAMDSLAAGGERADVSVLLEHRRLLRRRVQELGDEFGRSLLAALS